MSMTSFSNELYATPLSTFLREEFWIIPITQTIHIISISILVGSALVMDLRLAGVLATDETPGTVVRRHLPWLWTALIILLLTGLTLVTAEPNRELTNQMFWYKMGTVLFAFVLTLLFRYPILHPDFKLEHARWAMLVKPMAWVSLAAWIVVIFCGRWIAYFL